MRNKDKSAHLSLTDWGVCLNGEHFSVDLHCNDDCIEVDQIMTDGLAGRLNKKDGTRMNRPGDSTSRFETEESAIAAGVEQARRRYPDIKFVQVGIGTPCHIPWSVQTLVSDQMNRLYDEWIELHHNTHQMRISDRMDEIDDEWHKLEKFLEKYGD